MLPVWLLIFSCTEEKPEVQRAFYYWKNAPQQLSAAESELLKVLRTEKLYVRFFEVAPDGSFDAVPVSKSSLRDAQTGNLEIIPTVFLRNEVLQQLPEDRLDTLAANVVFLINKYYRSHFTHNKQALQEIQIDCDWTPSTRSSYFRFLRAVKQRSGTTLSCTLRLYPYKYRRKMGVPPVDKAVLMCYNLINPLAYENKNSILDNSELESYLRDVPPYPVHLDVALPVFSWFQVYQHKQFTGLLDQNAADLSDCIRNVRPMWYQLKKDTVIGHLYLRTGDLLKYEDVSAESIRKTIKLLRKHIAFDQTTTLALFHLDGDQLKQYNYETLSAVFNDFVR